MAEDFDELISMDLYHYNLYIKIICQEKPFLTLGAKVFPPTVLGTVGQPWGKIVFVEAADAEEGRAPCIGIGIVLHPMHGAEEAEPWAGGKLPSDKRAG